MLIELHGRPNHSVCPQTGGQVRDYCVGSNRLCCAVTRETVQCGPIEIGAREFGRIRKYGAVTAMRVMWTGSKWMARHRKPLPGSRPSSGEATATSKSLVAPEASQGSAAQKAAPAPRVTTLSAQTVPETVPGSIAPTAVDVTQDVSLHIHCSDQWRNTIAATTSMVATAGPPCATGHTAVLDGLAGIPVSGKKSAVPRKQAIKPTVNREQPAKLLEGWFKASHGIIEIAATCKSLGASAKGIAEWSSMHMRLQALWQEANRSLAEAEPKLDEDDRLAHRPLHEMLMVKYGLVEKELHRRGMRSSSVIAGERKAVISVACNPVQRAIIDGSGSPITQPVQAASAAMAKHAHHTTRPREDHVLEQMISVSAPASMNEPVSYMIRKYGSTITPIIIRSWFEAATKIMAAARQPRQVTTSPEGIEKLRQLNKARWRVVADGREAFNRKVNDHEDARQLKCIHKHVKAKYRELNTHLKQWVLFEPASDVIESPSIQRTVIADDDDVLELHVADEDDLDQPVRHVHGSSSMLTPSLKMAVPAVELALTKPEEERKVDVMSRLGSKLTLQARLGAAAFRTQETADRARGPKMTTNGRERL